MSVYLIISEDKFLIEREVKDIIKESGIDEFNIISYDIEETNISTALIDAQTYPFMSDRKLVVLKNIDFKDKEFNDTDLINYLEISSSCLGPTPIKHSRTSRSQKVII